MATAFQLSLSSTFLPSPLSTTTRTTATQPRRRILLRISSAATTSTTPKKKHWKVGEYPGVSETSSPQFSRNNKKRTPIKNIKKKLDKKNNAKAWANTVTEALSEAIDKKQWLRALQVFEMLKVQPFYYPKEGTYMKLLVLLGKSGQPGQACQLFDEMVEEGLEPTPELYTALLGACCRSNLIDKAFSILEQMKSLPHCQPDVYTYSILIKACVDACRFELVESLYDQMAERLIIPNTVTQNIVLSGYGKAGKYEEMEKVLSRMLESITSMPDIWTMNTILSLFGNEGQIEMMEQWYEKFRNFGVEPETRTFNILIGAYGKKRMYDKMSSVMEYMRRLSFPWTTSTYNNVIEAFSDAGDAKNMEYTFDQMRAEGMKADTKTFCCLIRGYANAGLFHKVINCVQLAGRLEIPENTSFFNAVIYACSRADDLMEMERVFKRMKDKLCKPDSTTYSIMMDAYRKEGMSDKVYDLEQEKEMMNAKISKEYDDAEIEASSDVNEAVLIKKAKGQIQVRSGSGPSSVTVPANLLIIFHSTVTGFFMVGVNNMPWHVNLSCLTQDSNSSLSTALSLGKFMRFHSTFSHIDPHFSTVRKFKRTSWSIKSAADDSGVDSSPTNDPSGGTRLIRTIQSIQYKIIARLKELKKNLPVKLFSFLAGFYCATVFATAIGQTGDWDVLSAALTVAIVEGIGALMYKASLPLVDNIRNLIVMFNYWKAGLSLGLFLDSFKF
ncbi:hypothetical protein BUALT_Bualt12G0106400 [Buddleja alternifolia]|uniref:Pentatricopeptide repeat-containing protein n=1 Tax=Buddleja alternifolia TaxID=168488 RepID=A0AAV6WQD9_9LAMI|nr:hypothetical protein BUALT_Bualt12G0106400 [Buddleja alternifolia]